MQGYFLHALFGFFICAMFVVAFSQHNALLGVLVGVAFVTLLALFKEFFDVLSGRYFDPLDIAATVLAGILGAALSVDGSQHPMR